MEGRPHVLQRRASKVTEAWMFPGSRWQVNARLQTLWPTPAREQVRGVGGWDERVMMEAMVFCNHPAVGQCSHRMGLSSLSSAQTFRFCGLKRPAVTERRHGLPALPNSREATLLQVTGSIPFPATNHPTNPPPRPGPNTHLQSLSEFSDAHKTVLCMCP